jgi:hypothetical protein
MKSKDSKDFQFSIEQQNNDLDIRLKISTEKLTALVQRLAWAIVTGLLTAGIFSGNGEFIFTDKPPPDQEKPLPVMETPTPAQKRPLPYQ